MHMPRQGRAAQRSPCRLPAAAGPGVPAAGLGRVVGLQPGDAEPTPVPRQAAVAWAAAAPTATVPAAPAVAAAAAGAEAAPAASAPAAAPELLLRPPRWPACCWPSAAAGGAAGCPCSCAAHPQTPRGRAAWSTAGRQTGRWAGGMWLGRHSIDKNMDRIKETLPPLHTCWHQRCGTPCTSSTFCSRQRLQMQYFWWARKRGREAEGVGVQGGTSAGARWLPDACMHARKVVPFSPRAYRHHRAQPSRTHHVVARSEAAAAAWDAALPPVRLLAALPAAGVGAAAGAILPVAAAGGQARFRGIVVVLGGSGIGSERVCTGRRGGRQQAAGVTTLELALRLHMRLLGAAGSGAELTREGQTHPARMGRHPPAHTGQALGGLVEGGGSCVWQGTSNGMIGCDPIRQLRHAASTTSPNHGFKYM